MNKGLQQVSAVHLMTLLVTIISSGNYTIICDSSWFLNGIVLFVAIVGLLVRRQFLTVPVSSNFCTVLVTADLLGSLFRKSIIKYITYLL